MKLQTINSLIGIVLLLAVGMAGAIFLTSTQTAQAGKAGRKLEGTWLVQVTLKNCQTGDDIRTFPALVTFASGGTVTETTTGFPPASRTPGHGFWKFSAGSYAATSDAFLFAPDGTFTGKQTIAQAIEFGSDPDQFTSTASVTIVDPQGNPLMSGCATAVGHRMK